jgi:glutathione S-transferase
MIRLYTWSTPNGVKISIALEEFGLDYEVIPVDIGKDEQAPSCCTSPTRPAGSRRPKAARSTSG